MKDKHIKAINVVLLLLASISIFIFASKDPNASAEKVINRSGMINGVPKQLRHEFKASDGSYFKGNKNSYSFYNKKDNYSVTRKGITHIIMFYDNDINDFSLYRGNSYYGMIIVEFKGSYKNVNKIKILYYGAKNEKKSSVNLTRTN